MVTGEVESIVADTKWVLQLCHGYSAPFGDVARQWHTLFDGSDYRVLTVFLTGAPDSQIKSLVGGEVIFLGFDSKALRGLKVRQIQQIRNLHKQYRFKFAIAHRYKSIYIASHLPKIKVFGVSHAYDVYSRFLRRRYVMSQSDRLFLIGVSNAIRDDARAALPRFPARKIQTVIITLTTTPCMISCLPKRRLENIYRLKKMHLWSAMWDDCIPIRIRLH